jgi:hypothetical protein
MKKVIKKRIFISASVLYFIIYLLLGNSLLKTSTSNVDYKIFDEVNSCTYTISQINFYDFKESNKSYQIYKHHTNFIKDINSLKCFNKIQIIEDGWPVVKVYISSDDLLFQLLKNSGLIIIFIFFINFNTKNKKLLLLTLTLFNFTTYALFGIDFISGEFKFLYSYEIILVEVLVLYLIFLRQFHSIELGFILSWFRDFIFGIKNMQIFILASLIGVRAVYIFFTNTYMINISDWLTNYQYGFIRRGLAGTILLTTSDDINFIAYRILPVILFLLHFSVVYYSLKIFQENEKNIYSLFALVSPLYILFPIFNVSKGVGNKELMGILCFLLIVHTNKKKLTFFHLSGIVCLYVLSVFSHEINLSIIPILLIMMYFKKIILEKKLIIMLLLITLIFICSYVLFPVSTEMINELCTNTYLTITDLDCTKAYYLEQGGLNSIFSSFNRVFEDWDYLLVYGIYFILSLFPFVASGWIQKNFKFFIFSLLGVFPLFIIAIDWGRWLNIFIFFLTTAYFLTTDIKDESSFNLFNATTLLFYSTLWRVPYCCVQEINITYLFRFDKFNFLIYLFLIYIIADRKQKTSERLNEIIKF